MPKAACCARKKSRRSSCGCAGAKATPSPARRSSWKEMPRDEARRPRDARERRPPPGVEALAAPPVVHQPRRDGRAKPPARGIRHHTAALRLDGAARAPRRRPQDERDLAAIDGHGRQCDRRHRPARKRRPRRARIGPGRPSRLYREAHAGGTQDLRSHGRGARAMGDRALRRARRRREGTGLQAAREAQALPRKGEGTMKHFLWEVEARVATITLNRPEPKNPLALESYAELPELVA